MDSSSSYHQLSYDDESCPEYQKLRLRSQVLNEEGAFCIEAGNYDDAIASLATALRTAEECLEFESSFEPCDPRSYCTLEECMAYSDRYYSYHSSKNKQPILHVALPSTDRGEEDGFIYQNPIRVVPDTSMYGCRLGMTLPLILTFNLALAHHLKAIQEHETTKKRLQIVMRLYETAYRWQREECGASQLSSLRFTMVISNNLGEIHRAVNNRTKHQLCLQHLLSIMMFAVDSLHEDDQCLDLEGFFCNTSKLILRASCAGAA
eukprot:scaffold5439_cov132-Cylindrotheca_fusiformis.AAC.3